ncbi:hypothetical protein SALBM311S_11985 [Streptomyces alboniger]
MPVGTPFADAQRGGDIARRDLAVPPGVLRGHRRVLTGGVQIRYGGRVPAREHLGTPREPQVGVDDQTPALQRLPGALDERIGPYADTPHEGARRHELAVGEQDSVGGGLLHGGPHAHLHAPLPQRAVGGPGQMLVQLGQHARRHVEEDPARPHALPQRVLAHLRVGVQLPLRGDLGAGVAGADHHEGGARGTALRIVVRRGQLHLPGHVVA